MVHITNTDTKRNTFIRSIFYTPRYSYFDILLMITVWTLGLLFQHPLIALIILFFGMTISVLCKMYTDYHDYMQKHPVGKYHM